MRSIADDRSRWRTHVLGESWAELPLSEVTRALARDWLSRLSEKTSSNPTHKAARRSVPLAAQTICNVLNLVRRAFEDAREEGLVSSNPFVGLRVRRSKKARTSEPWTVILPEELPSLLAPLSPSERLLVEVSIGTCARQGELWALRLSDLHLDEPRPWMLIRFGRFPDGPTKGGRPRRLPLFGLGLRAMREWVVGLSSYAPTNPHGLVFPTARGGPRPKGRPFRAWERAVRALGRPVRWHDLRHTGATWLYAGVGCEPWTLEAIQRMCGHSSITVTERYAHWLESNPIVERAARASEAEAFAAPERAAVATALASASGEANMVDRLTTPGPYPCGCASCNPVDNAAASGVEQAASGDENAPEVGHLSSVVEPRFRNSDAVAPASEGQDPPEGAAASAPAEGGDDAADEPPRSGAVEACDEVRRRAAVAQEVEHLRAEPRDARAALSPVPASGAGFSVEERLALREAEVRALRAALGQRATEPAPEPCRACAAAALELVELRAAHAEAVAVLRALDAVGGRMRAALDAEVSRKRKQRSNGT